MMKKYVHDPSHIVDFRDMEVQDDMLIEDWPVQITDRRDHVLRGKVIPLIRGQWSRHHEKAATWEREDQIRDRYPELFDESGMI